MRRTALRHGCWRRDAIYGSGGMDKEEPEQHENGPVRLPGMSGKEDAELAVFFFPGQGGSWKKPHAVYGHSMCRTEDRYRTGA